jgi:hypothetical protein
MDFIIRRLRVAQIKALKVPQVGAGLESGGFVNLCQWWSRVFALYLEGSVAKLSESIARDAL